ncbi:MAG: L,D-transpeptidase [Alphaproteobacteria bacterium HGW-Alphaproteobacteria-4]|jgi:lipoprotein-anchoring transpeptidase ErfK/SrfK|nr:MAG: L,D-transpeptidase [Alphaproteobacteria bacterium HGW-Alphaproteobacteria-4]
MRKSNLAPPGRRQVIFTGAAAVLLASVTPGWAQIAEPRLTSPTLRPNASSFRVNDWRDHFDTLKNGVILADTTSMMLQFWSEDGTIAKLYPTSVPLSDDLTRLGYTKVVRKLIGPSWAPTPAMKLRNPEWPDFVGPGPDNPLGTHALYLSWQYYRVHGTNDTRKIGRKSSNGCIGLYNEQIEELFALAKVGTQVKLI